MPTDSAAPTAIPLAGWADRQLSDLTEITGSSAITALDGTTLLGERATLDAFAIPARRSAGGGCHLFAARDGWVALNLAREADRELLPALFAVPSFDPQDMGELAELVFQCPAAPLVARGREMGLAMAFDGETPVSPAREWLYTSETAPAPTRTPLVIDLSALWAGPLCGHLLQLAGAEVVKVESSRRPDAMRLGDPAFFTLLNGGKHSVVIDLATPDGCASLIALLHKADIVIEAARPRALLQLGIDAEAICRARPGMVWITITGHGASGTAADWVGFGDDCGVAGGLSSALCEASGDMGFVGDAIADPLTGIAAALGGWQAWSEGRGGRIAQSMSGVVHAALDAERTRDSALLEAELRGWTAALGRPFPPTARREPAGELRQLGADNVRWLSC